MNIGVSGIVVNQSGELLVIQRDDTRTWAIPGGSLDMGEMPTEGVIREVEEETGFKVLPVRLVAVHYVPVSGQPFVAFTFRCLLRGGEPKTSRESLRVGYVKTNPIKVRMLGFHKKRVVPALTHLGKATFETYELSTVEKLGRQILSKGVYPLMNLRRRLAGDGMYVPPSPWRISVVVVICDKAGAVLWAQSVWDGQWQLPILNEVDSNQAPWDAAVSGVLAETGLKVRLTELTGVYTKVNEQVFVFSAEIQSGKLRVGPNSAEFSWLKPDNQHPDTLPAHIAYVADALDPKRELTLFKKEGAQAETEPAQAS